jgi:hypothetical protein
VTRLDPHAPDFGVQLRAWWMAGAGEASA